MICWYSTALVLMLSHVIYLFVIPCSASGGALFAHGADLNITNCTITVNISQALYAMDGVVVYAAPSELRDSQVWMSNCRIGITRGRSDDFVIYNANSGVHINSTVFDCLSLPLALTVFTNLTIYGQAIIKLSLPSTAYSSW